MRRFLSFASIVAVGTALSGCAGLSLPNLTGKPEIVRATAANPVMDVVSIWESGEGRGLNGLPSRGLAGQLMFFTLRDPAAALVDGDVAIYLFDDQGTPEEQSHPIWEKTFTSLEWNSLAMQTSLGTAYQLFVPYVRKGNHAARCSVRVKFTPADGSTPIYSKMSHVRLAGSNAEEDVATLERRRIEPKSYDPSFVTQIPSGVSVQPSSGVESDSSSSGLHSTTLRYPGQRRSVSPETKARLEQLAYDMVRDQQQDGAIRQVGHTVRRPASPVEDEASAASADGGRYRLYQ